MAAGQRERAPRPAGDAEGSDELPERRRFEGERGRGGGRGSGRGGRGGYRDDGRGKRVYDRQSNVPRREGEKKETMGRGNWGAPGAAAEEVEGDKSAEALAATSTEEGAPEPAAETRERAPDPDDNVRRRRAPAGARPRVGCRVV